MINRFLSTAVILPLSLFTATELSADMSQQDLIAAMREGGLVIFIRHASTERDYADQVNADPLNCATQRTLSRAGWDEAAQLGHAFRYFGIPVSDVVSSQYCRAWQTAHLAFGEYEMSPALNFAPAETYTEEQFAEMRDNMLSVISQPIPEGSNRVMVGHDDPFEAVTGIYPEPMGVTYILRPTGAADVEVLGHIDPTNWPGM